MRYEPIEIDGKWYVIDHKYPTAGAFEARDEIDAIISARVWSILGYRMMIKGGFKNE